MNQERIEYLFQRYLDRVETPAEMDELMALIGTGEHKDVIETLMEKAEPRLTGTATMNEEQTQRLFQAIRQRTQPVIRLHRWWGAAAAVIVLAIAVYLFYQPGTKPTPGSPVIAELSDVPAPATSKATIRLADGTLIALDSLNTLAQQNVRLTRTADGRIVYTGTAATIAYNTLTNPRGSQVIDITLADGSKVWLNAGSSITYPIAFTGAERKVTISGEAYFEVERNKSPFKVSVNNKTEVEVLGTHFNIDAYADDAAIKTTLLEGRVKTEQTILQPGQQAVFIPGASLKIENNVDMATVMAWKNGVFEFNETGIQTIMKQIERWYDVKVVFEGEVTQHFNGTIKRSVNVSKVLQLLEKTGGLKFSINGKTVTVKQG